MKEPKLKTVYVCSNCGETSPRWMGRCPSCGSWNTMNEDVVAEAPKAGLSSSKAAAPARQEGVTSLTARRLADISTTEEKSRILTGISELDRALGNGVSLLIGGYLPGSIVGMILLFASLCLHIVDAEMIRPAARFLLGAMALFFIPYGVGLMVSYEVLLDNFWAIVISGGVSTMLVLVCVGRVFQKLNKKA